MSDDHDRLIRLEQSLKDLWDLVRMVRDRLNGFMDKTNETTARLADNRTAQRRFVLTTTIAASAIVLTALGLIIALIQSG
jgi:ABC-type transporter Mla subunit MlaD